MLFFYCNWLNNLFSWWMNFLLILFLNHLRSLNKLLRFFTSFTFSKIIEFLLFFWWLDLFQGLLWFEYLLFLRNVLSYLLYSQNIVLFLLKRVGRALVVLLWFFGWRTAPIEIFKGLTVKSSSIGNVAFHLIWYSSQFWSIRVVWCFMLDLSLWFPLREIDLHMSHFGKIITLHFGQTRPSWLLPSLTFHSCT